MASAGDNGLIALWDVKVNKSIFSFNDHSHTSHKNVSIAWSKSVFAQIAVTLDDENKN
jgi:WD40 repeat protein